jgi:hypothetical protein
MFDFMHNIRRNNEVVVIPADLLMQGLTIRAYE